MHTILLSLIIKNIVKQAEAEVVPSSSLVKIEVEVALGVEVEVQLKCSYIKLG